MSPLTPRPEENGGYRHVMRIALPMVLSTAGSTIMSFVDRIFLAHYSGSAMAASLGAGITSWTLTSAFVGTAGYTSVIVAQYYGAGRADRLSRAVWQGVFFSLAAGLLLVFVGLNAEFIMGLAGHSPEIHRQEVIYFRIMTSGAALWIGSAALSGFYSGIGRTRVILAVETFGNLLNGVLDYGLIFGHWGLPEWGIKGAAIATVISGAVVTVIYALLLLLGPMGRRYRILRSPALEIGLLGRHLWYGFPHGLALTVDAVGWTAFVWLIGRLGDAQMEAVSATFAINQLAFLPPLGFAIATSILVGQFVGASRPELAVRATNRAMAMTFFYMASASLCYVLIPAPLVRLFQPQGGSSTFPQVAATATVLLRYVALYSLFDGGNLIFAGALRGAGDTKFVLWITFVLSVIVLIIPTYIATQVLHLGIYSAMAIATVYVIVLAISYYLRFRAGKWKYMRVIEPPIAAIDAALTTPPAAGPGHVPHTGA